MSSDLGKRLLFGFLLAVIMASARASGIGGIGHAAADGIVWCRSC